MRRPHSPPLAAALLGAAFGLALVTQGAGCAGAALFGGMIENHRRNSTHSVEAEYNGLVGKSFAVVVAADRVIIADHPDLVPRLTTNLTDRLAEFAGASGYVPAERLLTYLYEHPRWVAMPLSDLAKELGVERLVYIDIQEYRLNEPGNEYLWDGVAAAGVGVIEADSVVPDQFAFEREVRVKFPDKSGYGPTDYPGNVVSAALLKRFVDRASWLFYEHQEPYYPEY